MTSPGEAGAGVRLAGPGHSVAALARSPAGAGAPVVACGVCQTAGFGDMRGALAFLDAETLQPRGPALQLRSGVGAVAWADDGGRVLVFGTDEGSVCAASFGAGPAPHDAPRVEQSKALHAAPVSALAVSLDAGSVASCASDGSIQIFTAMGELVPALRYTASRSPMRSLAFSPLHRSLLLSCGDLGTVTLWDTRIAKAAGIHQANGSPVHALAWADPATGLVACGDELGVVSTFDLRRSVRANRRVHDDVVRCAVRVGAGAKSALLTAGDDGALAVHAVSSGGAGGGAGAPALLRATCRGVAPRGVRCCAVAPLGQASVAVGCSDGVLRTAAVAT
ncbi:unnamed protein product [Pedinophyceae sp. YPF-701]|nr:unnamed protein product [Pedinophyceae sp. YPF-701]